MLNFGLTFKGYDSIYNFVSKNNDDSGILEGSSFQSSIMFVDLYSNNDFSINIKEITRKDNQAEIKFIITKISQKPYKVNLKVSLIDDHDNEYFEILNINFGGANQEIIEKLPIGFTHSNDLVIDIPNLAPIEKICFEDEKIIYYKDIKFSDPKFKRNFGDITISSGESFFLGNYLTFTIGSPIGDVFGWSLPVSVKNSDYNPLTIDVEIGVQFLDGKIIWNPLGFITSDVLGLETVELNPLIVKISQCIKDLYVRMVIISCTEKVNDQNELKLFPLNTGGLPSMTERIAFEYNDYLYLTKTDGTNIRRFGLEVFGGGWNPDWAPDSIRIAFGGVAATIYYQSRWREFN